MARRSWVRCHTAPQDQAGTDASTTSRWATATSSYAASRGSLVERASTPGLSNTVNGRPSSSPPTIPNGRIAAEGFLAEEVRPAVHERPFGVLREFRAQPSSQCTGTAASWMATATSARPYVPSSAAMITSTLHAMIDVQADASSVQLIVGTRVVLRTCTGDERIN